MQRPNKQMREAIALGKELQEQRRYKVCVACNGSGRYDVKGSPKCSSCNGLGKVEAWKKRDGALCCCPSKV